MTNTRALVLMACVVAAACGGDAVPAPSPHVLTTLDVTLADPSIEVGQFSSAIAAGLDQDGAPVATTGISWSSSVPTIAVVNPASGSILAIAPGTTEISATAEGKTGKRILTVSAAPALRINEIQSKDGPAGGFIEIYNPTNFDVDLSGWTLGDNNAFGPHFTFPSGTVLLAGNYRVLSQSNVPFDINSIDSGRLFSRFGILVDGVTWSVQPPNGAGRCPNGTGPLVGLTTITRGGENLCP